MLQYTQQMLQQSHIKLIKIAFGNINKQKNKFHYKHIKCFLNLVKYYLITVSSLTAVHQSFNHCILATLLNDYFHLSFHFGRQHHLFHHQQRYLPFLRHLKYINIEYYVYINV